MGVGLLSKIVGSGVGDLATGIADIIDRFVETKEEKHAAEVLLLKIQQEPDRWQTEINKIEARHRTIFVAGWRPFMGWICGLGIGWTFLGKPLAEFIVRLMVVIFEPEITDNVQMLLTLPDVENLGQLITLVMAMLGMSSIRAWEKSQGLTR